MNLYKTLDLENGASLEDIKKSYRKLAKKYHPDKSSDKNDHKKFLEIKSAYEILSNDKTRIEYLKLPDENKNKFKEFLDNLFGQNIDLDSLSSFGISLSKKDMDYLKTDMKDILDKLNLNEIFKFFKDGILPKKDFEFDKCCSDSEIEFWSNDDCLYFTSLPVIFQKNIIDGKHSKYNLNISQNVSLEQIFKNDQIKITIKRKVINKKFINELSRDTTQFIKTSFTFNSNQQWIVFKGGGDISDDNTYFGDLIIKLNLPKEFDWQDNIVIYQKKINLYQFVYGVDIEINNFMPKFIIKKLNKSIHWVPIREGNIIFLCDSSNIKIAIKLIPTIDDDKKDICYKLLKEYFN